MATVYAFPINSKLRCEIYSVNSTLIPSVNFYKTKGVFNKKSLFI